MRNGKPRLVMTVGADGAASIDFLDADGKTIQRIPASKYADGHYRADAHIGQVSLTVRDLDRSLLFYRDVLGFRGIRRRKAAVYVLGASAAGAC